MVASALVALLIVLVGRTGWHHCLDPSMNISQRGLDLIKNLEGCVLTAYQDIAGVWTLGYGHTGDVKEGTTITPEAAEEILKVDLEYTEAWVNRLVVVELTQNQFDALVSFAFNVGVTALRYSTLLRLLNLGLYDQAAQQFLRWDKARVNGELVPIAGLAKRRLREKLLFQDKPAN